MTVLSEGFFQDLIELEFHMKYIFNQGQNNVLQGKP